MQLLVMIVEREWQRHNSIKSAIFQQCNAQGYWLKQNYCRKTSEK